MAETLVNHRLATAILVLVQPLVGGGNGSVVRLVGGDEASCWVLKEQSRRVPAFMSGFGVCSGGFICIFDSNC